MIFFLGFIAFGIRQVKIEFLRLNILLQPVGIAAVNLDNTPIIIKMYIICRTFVL